MTAEALVVGLPAASDPGLEQVHWWLVGNGAVIDRGVGADWADRAIAGDGSRRPVVGLAPVADVRLVVDAANGAGGTPRQRSGLARMTATEHSLGDPDTLHVVSSVPDSATGPVLTAVTANSAMLQWLDWARAAGAELNRIVPVAAMVPAADDWVSAKVGTEHFCARQALVIPDEPAIAEQLVGGAEVRALDPAEVDSLLSATAAAPPLDLRTGRFARRRLVIDRGRLRELAILAALIPLVTLLWALASIVRLDSATERLESQTLAIAEAALGRPVTLATAEAELRQRSTGVGPSFAGTLSGLYRHLQREASVSATSIGYGADGTLSAALAAPSVDPVNRVLVGLQRDGYRITAVPRQASDGRSVVDTTVSGAP